MSERTVHTNGVDLHVTEDGEGSPVILCHGFPELGYSWRHQIPALADAGYHVVAPDQRGYGRSSQPDAIDDYDIVHLTDDLLGLLDDLGHEKAVFVGHDWGSMVVWGMSLLHPDRVAGVVGMSVPFIPRGDAAAHRVDAVPLRGRLLLHALLPGARRGRRRPRRPTPSARCGGMLAGLSMDDMAEGAGLIADRHVRRRRSGLRRAPARARGAARLADRRTSSTTTSPSSTRTGFTGGINWYRNLDRNWELPAGT